MKENMTQHIGRRIVLKTVGSVGLVSLGVGGAAAANQGGGVTKQTRNVLGPSLVLADEPEDLTDCKPYDVDDSDARPVYTGLGGEYPDPPWSGMKPTASETNH